MKILKWVGRKALFLSVASFVPLSNQSLYSDEPPEPPHASLPPVEPKTTESKSPMDDVLSYLQSIIPLSLSTSNQLPAKDRRLLRIELQKIGYLATEIKNHAEKKNLTFKFDVLRMTRLSQEAYRLSWNKHFPVAKEAVLTMVNLCITCHSREKANNSPGESASWFDNSVNLGDLTSLEKARFFAATAKYAKALDEYEAFFVSKGYTGFSQVAVRNPLLDYLSIALRELDEYDRTLALLLKVEKDKNLPKFQLIEVEHWIKSIKKIIAYKSLQQPSIETAKDLFIEGSRMTEYSQDQKAIVYFLQASKLLTRTLEQGKIKANEALSDVYYLLGKCELMTLKTAWLPQAVDYLEAAIRINPKSVTANKAYGIIEKHVFVFTYAVRSNLVYPKSLTLRLEELKKLL